MRRKRQRRAKVLSPQAVRGMTTATIPGDDDFADMGERFLEGARLAAAARRLEVAGVFGVVLFTTDEGHLVTGLLARSLCDEARELNARLAEASTAAIDEFMGDVGAVCATSPTVGSS